MLSAHGEMNSHPIVMRYSNSNRFIWWLALLLVSERRKYLAHAGAWATSYFWYTVAQQEVDLMEPAAGILRAFEFKWNPKANGRIPLTWNRA